MFNLRWHFNRRGQWTGQSMDPGPFGYLTFLPAVIGLFGLLHLGPLIAWVLYRIQFPWWFYLGIVAAWAFTIFYVIPNQ